MNKQAVYLDTWSYRRTAGNLSITDRIKLSQMRKEQTLISGLDATKLALVIDISHWQGDVDIARMVSLGDVAMCFPKASDGKQVRVGSPTDITNYIDDWFHRNVQKCYDAKIPCAPYHYVQPAITGYTAQGTIDWNWEVIQKAFDLKVPKVSYHAIVLDVEEKNTSDVNASKVVMGLIDLITNHPKMGQVPLIVYTSMGVLNYYPALSDQLP